MARGACKLVSVNGALTVTFTTASGATPVVFSDEACTTTVALPATVADGANTTFYFASPGAYTLSVKTSSGTQIAGDLGSTRTISVTTGEVAVLTYDTRTVARDASGDSGRNAVNAALSGTYLATSTAVADYAGRIGGPTVAGATDARAQIQADLNAASDIAATGYYNYLTRRSVTVRLRPGHYYISAPGSGASIVVPTGVTFDFSDATLYFQPPAAATTMWCGVQVGQYANAIVGKMAVAPGTGSWPDAANVYDAVRVVLTDNTTRVIGGKDSEIHDFQGAGVRGVGAWITWVEGIRIADNVFGVVSSHLGDQFPYPIPTGAPYTSTTRVATDVWIDSCSIINNTGGGVIAGASGNASPGINALDTTRTYSGTVATVNSNIENSNSYAVSAGGPFVVIIENTHVEECGASDGVFNFDTVDLVDIRGLNFQYQGRAIKTTYGSSSTASVEPTAIFKLNAVQEFNLDGMYLLNNHKSATAFANAAATRGYTVKRVAISRYTGGGAVFTPAAGAMWSGGTHEHRASSYDKAHSVFGSAHVWTDSRGQVRVLDKAPSADADGLAVGAYSPGIIQAGGTETFDRLMATNAITLPGTQKLQITYFKARNSRTVTKMAACSGATAAGATPTLVKMMLFSVAANGDLTLLSDTVNDTSLFASTFTFYQKALASSVTLQQGTTYAAAVLVVSGAALPTLYGCASIPAMASGLDLQVAKQANGPYSDSPASVLTGAVSNPNGGPVWFALLD